MKLSFSIKKKLIVAEVYVYYLIFLNLIAFALESVKELEAYNPYFEIFERASLVIFSMEYVIRVSIAFINNRVKPYVFSFMGIIDLLSIVPLFLPTAYGLDLRFTKLMRFFQIFRIMKLYRYSSHLKTIVKVVEHKKEDLIATGISVLLFTMFFSCITYYFEKDAQPDQFSNLFMAIYWGVHTLASTTYGDIYPITIGGKIMSVCLALIGVGLVAIPAGILSAGFIEVQQMQREKRRAARRSEPTFSRPRPNVRPD